MNSAEKAKSLLTSSKVNLSKISRKLDMPLGTLQVYKHNPDKLKSAKWYQVEILAKLYDAMNNKDML